MKINEIKRTANVAWSPSSHHPIYLAAATAAQQLDSSFSTNACLELFKLNFDETQEPNVSGFVVTDDRLHKLMWSSSLNNSDSSLPELLIGGAGQGRLYIWNPKSILCKEESLVYLLDKHVGAVTALDINPFQVNLLASGAGNSEIFIWDLKDPEKPMTPGSKAQPLHDVVCVAWNRQVQHILGSSQDGNCIVWDLRKNEPIIQIRDSMSRMKSSLVCWHPDVATQLCIASEDDHTPSVQLWDLRSATSPVKQLEGHNRGILSLAWCPQDSGLLLSCGKDNRVLCWNPNSNDQKGEIVYELPNSNQWCFDVQWCPRNPGIISGCSFDGHVSIYSLSQGSQHLSDRVVDSFALEGTPHCPSSALKFAPKWLKRPCGASFGFGGKLVSFTNSKIVGNEQWASQVTVSQVVTEPLLMMRSMELEDSINSDNLISFCDKKLAEVDAGGKSKNMNDAEVWSFLKVSLEEGPQEKYLKLLNPETLEGGDDYMDISKEISSDLESNNIQNENKIEKDSHKLCLGQKEQELVTRALLRANFQEAVGFCVENQCFTEALMLAYAGGQTLFISTQEAILKNKNSRLHKLISAITNHDIKSIVMTYEISKWKEILLIIITYSFPEELESLCNMLGKRLEETGNACLNVEAQLCFIVAGNVEQLILNLEKNIDSNGFDKLQVVIEKATILQNSKKMDGICCYGDILSGKLTEYAEVLAEQGCPTVAMRYLTSQRDLKSAILKDRVFNSLGRESRSVYQPPPRPFHVIDIKPQFASNKHYSQMQFHQPEPFKAPHKLTNNHVHGTFSNPSHSASNLAQQQSVLQQQFYSGFVNNATLHPSTDLQRNEQFYSPPSHHLSSLYNPVVNNPTINSASQNLSSVYGQGRSAWNDPPPLCNKPSQTGLIGSEQMYQGQFYNPQDFSAAPQPPTPDHVIRAEPSNQINLRQEHKAIKEVFDVAIERCFERATNTLTRKKLDDISKKLMVLYSRLQEGQVSPAIVAGTHQIASCMQQSDYEMALAYHTQIVGMGNFSEISSFFPSIKILIHTASQLNIALH